MIQRSTATRSLTGDLNGTLLCHATSVFDYEAGTLVNTGSRVFAGTIAGSDRVVLFDDTFRLDVQLATGATAGQVHLRCSKDMVDGGWSECDLDVSAPE